MTQLYSRIFTQILDSSLAEDWQARHVFEDILKLSNDGILDMTRDALCRRTNVPRDVVDRALAILEAPDAASRDPSEDGRRIVRLDEHRDWGWRIVNWEKYEAIKCKDDQRAKTAERVRRHREKKERSKERIANTDTDPDPEETLQNVTKRYSDQFEAFWALYPKKIGKQDAARKLAIALKSTDIKTITDAVRCQMQSEQWTKEGGKYIPNPATWLHQGRWDDQVEPAQMSERQTAFVKEIRRIGENV